MSSPKAKKSSTSIDPDRGPVLTSRFVLAILLFVGGIAWIAWYYVKVRAGDGDPGKPKFMADLKNWNYTIGFVALMLGLTVSAHPSTPLGRNRGVVVGMLGSFLIGLVWICTFYIFADNLTIPVFNDLGNYNLVVGIGFMAVGFAFATRWE